MAKGKMGDITVSSQSTPFPNLIGSCIYEI